VHAIPQGIADVEIPDTRLVAEATELDRDAASPPIPTIRGGCTCSAPCAGRAGCASCPVRDAQAVPLADPLNGHTAGGMQLS
jgi:hypothetical protein